MIIAIHEIMSTCIFSNNLHVFSILLQFAYMSIKVFRAILCNKTPPLKII